MIGEPVTRIRRTATGASDRYGNPIYADAEQVFDGAAFDPGGTREPVAIGREQTVTTPKLYFQYEADFVPSDRVRVRGDVFLVTGRPAVWRSPFGTGFGGTVVELERSEG